MRKVLVVYPREGERERISQALKEAGFQVTSAADNETALKDLAEMRHDLIVMANDSAEGQKLCGQIRGLSHAPIIITGQEKELSRVVTLQLGADIYIAEPVGTAELVAWAHALLRRHARKHGLGDGHEFDPENLQRITEGR